LIHGNSTDGSALVTSARRKLKISITVLLLALAVGAIGVPTAAAEWEWQLEEQQLAGLTESETISGPGGTFTLATTIGGVSASVRCEKEELTSSTITPEGKGASTLQLSQGCQVVGKPTCVVTEPINLKSTTEVFTAGTKLYNRYSPAETKFATVKISGCIFSGEYAVEGTFAGEFEAGEERANEPITFSPKIGEEAGTKLTVGGNAATLEGKLEMAASGAYQGQKVAAVPLQSDPMSGPVFPGTKVGKSDTKTITHTVIGKKNVKFGTVQIVGSAGILSIESDTCSKNEFKPTETCKITVKFAPKEAKEYKATVVTPWETADGIDFGLRLHRMNALGT
jgi:hypothetical protein